MNEVVREFKECVFVDGILQNVGPWQYNYQEVYMGMDENEKPIFEIVATNPLPANAVIDHRWFLYTEEKGWYLEGTEPPLNFTDETRRSFSDLFTMLVEKKVITIDEVPVYKEYDYKAEVEKKMSESDA